MSDLTRVAIDVLVRLAFFLDSISLRHVYAWAFVLLYAALCAVIAFVIVASRKEARAR